MRPLLLPPRRSRRCQYRPTATAQSLWKLLSYYLRPLLATHRLHLPSWMPLATLLNCSSLIPSRVVHMSIGSDNSRLSRRATPQCATSPSAGRRPCQPTFGRATLRTTNRLYRRMRIGAAQLKLSRNHGERFLAPGYALPHARSGSAATATRCSPREPTFGTRATMGCGGLVNSVRVRRRTGYTWPEFYTIRGRSSSLFSRRASRPTRAPYEVLGACRFT